MSDPEHVKKLLGREQPFKFYNLSEITIKGDDFRNMGFNTCTFSRSVLAESDFSGSSFNSCSFDDCDLTKTNFSRCKFNDCSFDGSNWNQTYFNNAYFNGGSLKKIINAANANGLTTVSADGFTTEFDSYKKYFSSWVDWERIKVFGRLPFFTGSSITLVAMPFYFYLIGTYNQHITTWKALTQVPGAAVPERLQILSGFAQRLPIIPIPSLSLLSLISALTLFFAALIYNFFCPAIVKEFSRYVWNVQFQRSMLTYMAQSWKFKVARLVCLLMYLIGASIAAVVVSINIYSLMIFLIRNNSIATP